MTILDRKGRRTLASLGLAKPPRRLKRILWRKLPQGRAQAAPPQRAPVPSSIVALSTLLRHDFSTAYLA